MLPLYLTEYSSAFSVGDPIDKEMTQPAQCQEENFWIIHWSHCMCPVCQGIGEILPPCHPYKIKEAWGIEHWRYCLPFTEVVNNCQICQKQMKALSPRWGEFDPALTWMILPDEGRSNNPTVHISVQQKALSQSTQFSSFEETRSVPLLTTLQACAVVNPAYEAVSVVASMCSS